MDTQKHLSDIAEQREIAERLSVMANESTPEEAIAHQCIILTVIAEQLVQQNATLERIASHLENGQIAVLTSEFKL